MPKLRIAALALTLASLGAAGCSDDDASSGSSSTSSSSSSGGAAAPKVVVGISIPSTIKLCPQSLTAVSSSASSGFSWSVVASATRYAVLAQKAPKDATTLTEVFNGIVEGTARGGSYTFPEKVAGTSYTIEVYALAGSEPLCQLDGVNGFTG